MAKRLNVNLAFTADTGQAKAQIQDLQNQLSHLSMSASSGQTLGLTKELNEATVKVTELKGLLASATTSTGSLDLGLFNEGLKKSGTTIKDYARVLNSLGPEGQQAFSKLAQAVTMAEMPMRRANGLLSEMWTTMKNTARWQLTSSVLHGFIGGLSSAVGYAKDLNKTLTDIRIVAPEKSMEDMARFSKIANKQAKELSSTTLDYAKAALIYYQQGEEQLGGEQAVLERTDVTTKMANVTGDSVDEVSSYMTAIWNNFNKAGDESAEHFADILTKLGAETAASTTEITDAIEKYSAVADTIGLSYEAATAAATTLIDRTREAPEVAGTALKTVFARLEGLKVDGSITDEDGVTTTFNKYSQTLEAFGISIKDANGELKAADDILDEVGHKWKDLERDQQVALAQNVAGIRQWNQFAALMDNYDYFEKYKEMAETGSAGALQEQQDIYAESWEAARDRVTTAIQSIYMQLLDDKFFIKLTNIIADITDDLSKFIEGIGGLKTVLPLIGSLMISAFGDKMAKSLEDMTYNMRLFGKTGKEEMHKLRKEANEALVNQQFENTFSGQAAKNTYNAQFALQNQVLDKQEKLNEHEQRMAQFILDQNAALGEQLRIKTELIEKGQEELENKARTVGNTATVQREDESNADYKARKELVRNDYNQMMTGTIRSSFLGSMLDDLDVLKDKMKQAEGEEKRLEEVLKQIGPAAEAGDEKAIEEQNKLQKELEETRKKAQQVATEYNERVASYNSTIKNNSALTDIGTINDNVSNSTQMSGGISAVEHRLFEADEQIDQAKKNLIQNSELSSKAIMEETKALGQQGTALAEASRQTVEYDNATKAASQSVDNLGKKLPTVQQGIMSLSQMLMNIAMAYNAIKNIGNIWSNEDLSTGEKIFETMSAISMLLPTLIALLDAENVLKLASLPASAARALGLGVEADAAMTAAAANTTLGNSFKALWASMGPLLPLLIVAGAAIAGIVLAVKSADKEMHQFETQFEHAKQTADEATNVYNEINTKINDISTSLSDLDSKRETLNNLTEGTEEWEKALNDVSEAEANVKTKIEDLANSSQVQDFFAQNGPQTQDVYDENGNKVDTIERTSGQLEENVDYIRDAETGAIVLTDAGKQWAEILKDIADTQAKVTNDAAQMQSKFTEMSASTEKIRNDFGSFQNADNVYSPNATTGGMINSLLASENNKTVNSELTMDVIEQISTLFATDRLSAKDFSELDVADFAEKAGISEDLAALIQEDSKLTQALIQNGQLVKDNTESMSQMATEDLLKNQTDKNGTYEKIYGEDSKIEKKWRSGLADYMGEEVARQTNRGISDEDWKKNQDQYRESYAAQNNLTYDAKKNKFTDSEGNEKDINDDDVKSLVAYNQALNDVNANFEKYREILKDTKRDNKALANVKEIWDKQSSAIKEASKELKNHKKEWKNLDKDLTKGIEKTAEQIRGDLVEALDLSDLSEESQKSLLDGEFLVKNAEDIEAALNGDVEALNRLQSAAAEQYVIDFASTKDNFNDIKDDINSLNKEISSLNQDIEIGAKLTGDDEFVQKCQNMIDTAGMTAKEAREYFASMGYDVEFENDEEPPETFTQYQPQIQSSTVTLPFKVPRLSLSGMLDGIGGEDAISWQDVSFNVPSIHFGGYDAADSKVGGAKATALKIKTLTKTNGGNISSKNRKATNRTDSPRRGNTGGGNKGKKGSSGSSKTDSRPSKKYEKTSIIERYKEITDKINLNAKETEKLAKVQDKLYGNDRLKAMDEVNKNHLEEIKLLRRKSKEAGNYLRLDKDAVQKRLKEALDIARNKNTIFTKSYLTSSQMEALKNITSVSFDKDGTIKNYTQIMKAMQDELNNLEYYYNNKDNFGDSGTAQEEFKTKKIDPLKEAIDRLQSAINQYDETRELIEELKTNIDDAYAEWLDGNYEKLTYSLEIKMTVNDNDLHLLEHKISQIQDNIYKSAEILDYYVSGSGDTKLKNITDAIKIQTNNFKELDKAYQNGQITQNQYRDGLQNSYEALMSNTEALINLKEELTDYYGSVLEKVMSEMDKYISRAEHINSLTDHYKNILELTGKATDYNLLEQLQAANAVTAITLINMNKAEFETASYEADKYLKAYNEIKEKIKERQQTIGDAQNDKILQNLQDEAEVMRKAYEAALETANNAEEQMFSSVQDALDNAAAALETSLERAAKAVEKALTGIVGSFDELARQMNLTSTRQEEYLTKTNQSYELNKMQRTLAKDMDKTDSRAAKTRLANFAKELKALEEKDELSNLELEIAQKKYELLKAQIALEDSQNAKSVIRLSRDNEGNYGYVYVANEEQTEDAEQAVEDAKNDLYNLQLEATNEYGQKYTQMVQEYYAAIQEVQVNRDLNDEEREYRLNKLQEQYEPLIQSMQDIYGIAWGSTDYLVEPLQQEAWMYKNYNDNINLMQNNLGSLNTYIDDTTRNIRDFNIQVENIVKYVNFEQRMEDVVTTTENTMNQLAKDFEDTGEQVTKVLNDVGVKIFDFVNNSIEIMNKWIDDTDSIVENIKNIIENATNGKIDRTTENLNEFIAKWSNGAKLKYTDNHIAYNDTKNGTYNTVEFGLGTNAVNWTADTIAKNEVTAGKLLEAFESGQSGYFGFNKNGLMSYITGVTTADTAYKNWAKKVIKPTAFDTGGYTGEWTNDGKIAVLHEKELVLNESDTRNILNAVNVVRDKNFLTALSSPSFAMNGNGSQFEQNVKIEAEFPNVTDRYEIEQAFNNLVNRASQHAFNNRK